MLRDQNNNLAAGWKFDKLIEHWKRKHSNTCYVSYSIFKNGPIPSYQFGPKITLGQGTSLEHFLKALHS
ncbi:MvaI/BcnI family restriction endonuclease, partial [Aeromonas veronii]